LRPRQSRIWVPVVAALLVVALTALDLATGRDIVIVPLYVLGPLLAALAATPQATAVVGLLAAALGIFALADVTDFTAGQDVIRAATVILGSALAVWIAMLRQRLASTAGLLDVTFERAPVGLALMDADGRYVRVNERLAEIDNIPAADHVGRTIAELLPSLPEQVRSDVARVARTGEPLIDVEVSGDREYVASYWPIVRPAGDEVIGVGIVVSDVTERRLAERALRDQTDRYEALLVALSDAGEGLLVLERDGRCAYANPAFEQLSGYTFPELAAMHTVLDLVVEYENEERRRGAVARLDEGLVRPALPLTLRRRDGGLVDVEVGGVRLDVEGRRQLVVVVRDVSDRRRAEAERERRLARSALLAEASELFDQSLDAERTLASVARLCVRDLARACVIRVDYIPPRVVSAAREPGGEVALSEALGDGSEPPPDAIVVPLAARGRQQGVLAVVPASAPTEDDRVLFADLGRRAALALDSARLYAERDHVARTLQHSLLPRELPDIPGVDLAARYHAAGEGNEVGGDFYDCFATGAGDWALVIGDVCGKGAEAAALTALARYTLRAAALNTRRPRAVLEQLNEALLRDQLDYRFCTVLYASLTPREDRISVCVTAGGHPLPLVLRASGEVETAGVPGSLLGIVDRPELSEERIEMLPGDALVLYTDGVTEADRESGPEWLSAMLARCAGADATAIAATVERDALAAHAGPARDDVAVVVVRAQAGAASFDPRGEGVATAT
jgi:PAS domain S-box-containing protein